MGCIYLYNATHGMSYDDTEQPSAAKSVLAMYICIYGQVAKLGLYKTFYCPKAGHLEMNKLPQENGGKLLGSFGILVLKTQLIILAHFIVSM